eukprot:gene9001-6319_t
MGSKPTIKCVVPVPSVQERIEKKCSSSRTKAKGPQNGDAVRTPETDPIKGLRGSPTKGTRRAKFRGVVSPLATFNRKTKMLSRA